MKTTRFLYALALAGLLGALLVGGDARATAVVFHSELNDGNDQTPAVAATLANSSSEPVHLYVKRGTLVASGGTVCDELNSAPGDEICGAHVVVEVQGAGHLVGIGLLGTDVTAHPTNFAGNPTTITLTVARAVPVPTTADEFFLATLNVDTSSAQRTDVVVTGAQIVNAKNQLEAVQGEVGALVATTFVPEPSLWLQLGPGLLGLAWLNHRHKRRARGAT